MVERYPMTGAYAPTATCKHGDHPYDCRQGCDPHEHARYDHLHARSMAAMNGEILTVQLLKEPLYSPEQLRVQVGKMHPASYAKGKESEDWLLNVGKAAGMLSVVADQLEHLRNLLRICEAYLVGCRLHHETDDQHYQAALADVIQSVRDYLDAIEPPLPKNIVRGPGP